jgi:hypothetical protein
MRENKVHDLIINDMAIQYGINNILSISNTDTKYIHEDTYINGITADFTVIENDKIRAIIECKAGDIGVTDYVRGIGQSLQYEYFYEENISPKGFEYHSTFDSILLFPSSVVRDNNFNIGNFKYPKTTTLYEINDSNNVVRKIEQSELDNLKKATKNDLVTISQYYFRDNRIYEYYIVLKYVSYLKFKGEKNLNRTNIENNFLRKINTHNNKNWRNAFITLSSLGLINSDNLPTPFGITLAHSEFEEFAAKILISYMIPYVNEIFECFNNETIIELNNQDIKKLIYSKYKNRDVLFLTESDGRYISSWLNIFRDDYGCIEFEPRNKKRTIKYNPSDFNENSLKQKIKKHSVAYEYIDIFNSLLKDDK